MAAIVFRSPVTRPLKLPGQCSPASDDFCITQRFGDPDFYWSNVPNPPNPLPTHQATDIGNFRCGYPIVAMAAGIARRVQDNATALGAPNNALGIQIDHGYGIQTAYWHLASWTAPDGSRVQAGQEIGKLGNTGLGQVCHCHIEATRNGVKFDPEPLMFGGSVQIGDDVKLPGRFARHIQNRQGRITQDAHFRSGVLEGDDASLGVIPRDTLLYPIVVVIGRAAGTAPDAAEWYGALAYIANAYQLGFIHSSLWPRTTDGKGVQLEAIEQGSGASPADLAAARAVGFQQAKVKATAAVTAITP